MNLIPDSKVTSVDAKCGFHIFGKDPAFIQGKTKRQRPDPVPNITLLAVPDSILTHHKDIILCVDIFHLNGLRFFHTISKNLQLRTVEYIKSATYKSMLDSIYTVINLYQSRDFDFVEIRGDYQFKFLEESLRPIHLYTTSGGEHVPEVERSIQTLEGDARTVYHSLPYKHYPRELTKSLVEYVNHNRNIFTTIDGISSTMSPNSIITGLPNPPESYFSLEFGTFAHAHDHPDITNTVEIPRTTPSLALLPANRNGGWYFFKFIYWGTNCSLQMGCVTYISSCC